MLGQLSKDKFKPSENYDDFYKGHAFEPVDEYTAYNFNQALPRAGWAYDVAEEVNAHRVLDLCCLDGSVVLCIANKLGIDVVGVDLSEPGIKLANERAKKKSLPAQFIQCAVEDYEGPKFDMIIMFEAIEHFQDVDKVIAVIKAHLRPGGTLLVSTPDAEHKFGIANVEDTCHLTVWTTKHDGELPSETPEGKPIRSLPDYLESQGFTVVENEVYNDLINVRATI